MGSGRATGTGSAPGDAVLEKLAKRLPHRRAALARELQVAAGSRASLTRYELRQVLRRVDDTLVFEEVSAAMALLAEPGSETVGVDALLQRVDALHEFNALDANRDGVLTPAEFFARARRTVMRPATGAATTPRPRPAPADDDGDAVERFLRSVADVPASPPVRGGTPTSPLFDERDLRAKASQAISKALQMAEPELKLRLRDAARDAVAGTPVSPHIERRQQELEAEVTALRTQVAVQAAAARMSGGDGDEAAAAALAEVARLAAAVEKHSMAEGRARAHADQCEQEAARLREQVAALEAELSAFKRELGERGASSDASAARVRELEAAVAVAEHAAEAARAEAAAAAAGRTGDEGEEVRSLRALLGKEREVRAAAERAARVGMDEMQKALASETHLRVAAEQASLNASAEAQQVPELRRILDIESQRRVAAEEAALAATQRRRAASEASGMPGDAGAADGEAAALREMLAAERTARIAAADDADLLRRKLAEKDAELAERCHRAEMDAAGARDELASARELEADALAASSARDEAASLRRSLQAEEESRKAAQAEASQLRDELVVAKEEVLAMQSAEKERMHQLMEREKRLLNTVMGQLSESQSEQARLDDYCEEMNLVYRQLEALYHSLKQGEEPEALALEAFEDDMEADHMDAFRDPAFLYASEPVGGGELAAEPFDDTEVDASAETRRVGLELLASVQNLRSEMVEAGADVPYYAGA